MAVAENNLLRSEAAERARLLDDLHYDVTLDVTGEGLFRSETRLRCRAVEEASPFGRLRAQKVVLSHHEGG